MAVPGQPPRLTHEELQQAQVQTLDAPRRRYGIAARVLFVTLDVAYGKARTLGKFKVLELVARVPYQAWQQVAFVAITHRTTTPRWLGASTKEWVSPARSRTTRCITCSSSKS
jgi:hypothetical protein